MRRGVTIGWFLSAIAVEALTSGREGHEIVLEKGYLSQAELDAVLSPRTLGLSMARPHPPTPPRPPEPGGAS